MSSACFCWSLDAADIIKGARPEALKRAGGVKVKAVELLGMSFRSFRYYMKKYDLK
jgi:two-component system response regulator PilR (NtrC family)